MRPEDALGTADALSPGGSDFDDLSNIDRFLLISERVTFLDTPTALRRFEAISVGDAGPHVRGATIDGYWIDYDGSSIHANAFREAWQREQHTHQRERDRQ